jgi:hypothetical protein
MFESDYVQAGPPKPSPPLPVRVSCRWQLMAALRQRSRPIVIEDQELAHQFGRLVQARECGDFIANTMSESISRCYGTDIEAQWYMGQYVLPGNVQKVILKPKQGSSGRARALGTPIPKPKKHKAAAQTVLVFDDTERREPERREPDPGQPERTRARSASA